MRGATYNVSVERLGENWKLWGEGSHTYGQPVSELPWWKYAAMVALCPFGRSLDRPWGSVIVRFGATGNEESFMDPDPVPVPSEHLSENMTPGKDGQMFIYLNKPVVVIPGFETMISNLMGSTAKAPPDRKADQIIGAASSARSLGRKHPIKSALMSFHADLVGNDRAIRFH